jgi:hypothetical protein
MPATHITEGCPVLNCLFTTRIHWRDVDCRQTTCNKSWQLPATFCNSSVPVLPEPRELLWCTWVNSGQTSNLHKSRRLQCWHTRGGSEGVGSSFRLKEPYYVLTLGRWYSQGQTAHCLRNKLDQSWLVSLCSHWLHSWRVSLVPVTISKFKWNAKITFFLEVRKAEAKTPYLQ